MYCTTRGIFDFLEIRETVIVGELLLTEFPRTLFKKCRSATTTVGEVVAGKMKWAREWVFCDHYAATLVTHSHSVIATSTAVIKHLLQP